MIHIPNRTGVEPVNGAVLRWREMAQLMHPHNKTTKGSHTHTHIHNQDLLPDQTIPGTSERRG